MDESERPKESDATLEARIAAAREQAFKKAADDQSNDSSPDLHAEWPEHGGPPHQIAQFQIQRLIARGGSSWVFEAWQAQPPRRVALKVLRDVLSAEAIRRFEYEGRLLAKLEHPNIVRIYEVGHWNDHHVVRPYIAMEFIGRRTLLQHASEQQSDLRQRIAFLIEVCQGVQHAHLRGIIHRDLKPDNIAVDDAGRPKVLDFGVAKAIAGDTTMHTVTGQWLGTPMYMSPEQFTADADSIDMRCDVYALGAVGYELLSGNPPFSQAGRTAAQVVRQICEEEPPLLGRRNPALRGDVETIIAKALQKEPSDRYDSAAQLAADLQRYLDSKPIAARRIGWWGLATRWARREPATAAASLISAALALLLLVALFTSFRESQQRAERQREQLYASNINLAMQAFYDDNLQTADRLMQQQIPGSDAPDLRGFAWYHLWNRLHAEQRKLNVHSSSIWDVEISPDDTKMVSCGDGEWCLWDTTEWRLLHRYQQTGHVFSAAAFLPDGRSFLTASFHPALQPSDRYASHRIRMWDAATGELQRTSEPVPQEINALGISSDGTSIYSGGGALQRTLLMRSLGELNVFEVSTLKHRESPVQRRAKLGEDGHYVSEISGIASLAVFPDGRSMATAHANAPARLWDLQSGQSQEIAVAEAPQSASVDVSPDGRLLVIGNWNEQIVLWDVESQRVVRSLPQRRPLQVRFSPDGNLIAAASNTNDYAIYLWDTHSGKQIDRLSGHSRTVWCLRFRSDGKELVSGSEDQSIRVWDLRQRHQPQQYIYGQGEIPGMAISSNRRWLAFGTRTGTANVWDVAAAKPAIQLQRPSSHVNGVAMHPDRDVVAFGFADLPSEDAGLGRIQLYQLPSGDPIREMPDVSGSCSDLAFSPDGRLLGAAYLYRENIDLHQLQVWDTQTWRSWKAPSSSSEAVNAIAFSPDSRRVVTCGDDRRVRLWNALTGEALAASHPLSAPAVSVAYAPGGAHVAVGTWPRGQFANAATEVRLLNAESLETQHVMLGHTGGAYGLGFSPDGSVLASGAAGGLVKLWDLRTYTELATLRAPGTGWVFEVEFSSDGRSLFASYGAVTSECGVVRFDAVRPDEIEAYQQRCRVAER